jgi:hypothetical protein
MRAGDGMLASGIPSFGVRYKWANYLTPNCTYRRQSGQQKSIYTRLLLQTSVGVLTGFIGHLQMGTAVVQLHTTKSIATRKTRNSVALIPQANYTG